MTKPRIAYIISMVKSGVPAFTYREIDVLREHGFEIALFPLTYREGPYMPKLDWPVVKPDKARILLGQVSRFLARPWKYIGLMATALRTKSVREFALGMYLAGEMRRWGAERIHCHFGDSKLYTGYYCAQWLDLPITVTMHAYEIHRNPNPAMLAVGLPRCEKIVVQSEFNRGLVVRNFGVSEDKIALIRAHGDMSDPANAGTIKVLMVGEFREKKGHETLLSAVEKLERGDIRLWLVGDGPLDVPAMAREKGLDDRAAFLGMVGRDMLNILYEACDMFVLPSRTASDGDMEGIPAVLMEAMSHAKPVISTRHAGIPELVEEILVDENDVDSLAAAISKLADDPALRQRLGRRNLEIVRTSFSDDAVLELGDLFK